MTISQSRCAEQIGIYQVKTRAKNLLFRLAKPSTFSTDDRYTRKVTALRFDCIETIVTVRNEMLRISRDDRSELK